MDFLLANPAWMALLLCLAGCAGCVIWSARQEVQHRTSMEGQMWFQRFFALGVISLVVIIVTGVRR